MDAGISAFFGVDSSGVECLFCVAKFELHLTGPTDRHSAIEARTAPGMTGAGAFLLYPEPHRILVAVDAHLAHTLHVTGTLPFAPERPA